MQSRKASLIESVFNVLAGLLVSVAVQSVVFPQFGFTPSMGEQVQIAGVFTVAGIARSYVLRRLFNWFSAR